ncbi:hypothetical protein CLV58_11190 [Spirosoma oryzae]|uniref:Uncharacterized protein n=1 Tax=Spirosoma oryzae TaxID=1469603 RepID=A0A2T0SUG3_9BACT|nr:hypothetical protein CLV58_11190 [Spirosoma oryzae]
MNFKYVYWCFKQLDDPLCMQVIAYSDRFAASWFIHVN